MLHLFLTILVYFYFYVIIISCVADFYITLDCSAILARMLIDYAFISFTPTHTYTIDL